MFNNIIACLFQLFAVIVPSLVQTKKWQQKLNRNVADKLGIWEIFFQTIYYVHLCSHSSVMYYYVFMDGYGFTIIVLPIFKTAIITI